MSEQQKKSSWIAFGLFYLVLIIIVTVLDMFNGVLRLPYWGAQVSMITVGVGLILAAGMLMPNMSAARGVFLAFTVGILTIIPAVLMGLGQIPGLWPQYFYVAFGMAAGIFMTFLFLKLFNRVSSRERIGNDSD
jgi:hypothetical protein